MVNTTINKFGKKLPPVKTGQRFGEKVQNNKKVGLFSERRFLVFTKKGPIEIAFKPVHYTSLLITTIVGLTSIIYWSAKGIYSAIDVAKKDIITEAVANINNPIENDSDTIVNINISDQSNIYLPSPKNQNDEIYKKSNNNKQTEIQNSSVKSKISNYSNVQQIINEASVDNTNENDIISLNENINKSRDLFNNILRNQNIPQNFVIEFGEKFANNFNQLPKPPKLTDKVKSIRFLASVDNELTLMESVFKAIRVKIQNDDVVPVDKIFKENKNLDPNSIDFFTSLKARLNLLAIYKDALQFIPLKPPMEHYYVSSPYGKRKHPVTGKFRMHHGIDLAGTWQEDVSVSADGTVVFAGYHGSFGKVIRIKHNYGIMTTYGHLAKIKVRSGDLVNEGQVIGKMGRTGRVNGAHLHYEISVNGKSQNPAIYIKIGRNLLSRTSLKGFVNKIQ